MADKAYHIARAAEAVAVFQQRCRIGDEHAIADLICDLGHSAEERGIELSGRWGWMLASGIVDLALASVILIGLPATSAWAMGLIVGINLAFGGAAMIGMALSARPRIGRANA
jgi:hypothetical protein